MRHLTGAFCRRARCPPLYRHYRIHLAKYAFWWAVWFHNEKSRKHLGTEIIQISLLPSHPRDCSKCNHSLQPCAYLSYCPPGLKYHFSNWILRRSLSICRAVYHRPALRCSRGPGALILFPQLEEHLQTRSGEIHGALTSQETSKKDRPLNWDFNSKKCLARRVQPRLSSGDKENTTSFRCQG